MTRNLFLRLDWTTISGITAMHLLCILAPFFFSWSGFFIAIVLWWFVGCWGVCIGYHRLLTHRSFNSPKWFEYFLAILGVLNWQGGPIRWVGVHRIHHAHSDEEGDPHTPQHGFTWAHMFWLFLKNRVDALSVTKDLQRDPVLVFIDRWASLPQIILAILLFGLGWLFLGSWNGGMSWFIWGVCVRTVFVFHSTWFVNSASHTWGYQNFDTGDNSKNNWWVALLAFGEGWHNNHHAQQRSAAHGMRWWEIDFSYLSIRFFELIGLAKNVVRPKLD